MSREHANENAREGEVVAELLAAAIMANGDHSAPHDCYATGPRTGYYVADLVVCPGCRLAKAIAAMRAQQGAEPVAWQPIETAPKDGTPVWVRGWNWGKEGTQRHACYAWWDGEEWRETKGSDEAGFLRYLTDWYSGAPR
jgi:hypothetical protein